LIRRRQNSSPESIKNAPPIEPPPPLLFPVSDSLPVDTAAFVVVVNSPTTPPIVSSVTVAVSFDTADV